MEKRRTSSEERTVMPFIREQELEQAIAEIIMNKELDAAERIELARQYVEPGNVVAVPVMTLITMDGMATNDGMSSEEFSEFCKTFDFNNNTYIGNQYDARTPSQTDETLTLRVTEKGVTFPSWTESFYGGSHSIWDHQVDVDVLVNGK